MPVVADKYRGTADYHVVHAELVSAARYRGTLTYQEVAALIGLPLTGSYMQQQVGQVLGEISEDEHLQGRPMLSAIVTSVSGQPSIGFFNLAKDLNLLEDDTAEGRRRFLEQQRRAIYGTWRRQLKTKKASQP